MSALHIFTVAMHMSGLGFLKFSDHTMTEKSATRLCLTLGFSVFLSLYAAVRAYFLLSYS